MVDEIDRKLLDLLQTNARVSNAEMAEAVGLIRELTPRGISSPTAARPNRGARMVLLAPLKRLTRSLFGGRK